MWKLGDDLAYDVIISWAKASADGCYDVFFNTYRKNSVQPQFSLTPLPKQPWNH